MGALTVEGVDIVAVGYRNCAPSPEARILKSMRAQVAEARSLLG